MSDTIAGTSLEHAEEAAPVQEFGGEPAQPEQAAAAPAEEAAQPETEEAEDEAQAIEIPTGKVVPLSALQEARATAKALKAKLAELEPASQEAAQLRQYLNDAKPYIEFLKANPQFLQPQQAQPQRAPEPQDDPEAVEYAKEFDLYTADGKPDTARARRIIDKQMTLAQKAAQQATAPLAHQAESHKVYAVLQQLSMEKDADGNVISPQAINAVAQELAKTLGQDGARRFLASDESYEIVSNMAWGKHAKLPRKKMPAPPENPPLETERAGGGEGHIVVDKRRLGALGISEAKYKESAKNFKQGAYNTLEE